MSSIVVENQPWKLEQNVLEFGENFEYYDFNNVMHGVESSDLFCPKLAVQKIQTFYLIPLGLG